MNKYLRLSISFHLTNATSRSHAHTPVCMGRGGGVGMGTDAISPINQAIVGDEHDIDDKLTVTIKIQSHF